MRILIWEHINREMEGNAAFNVQLLRAIDPRLITHRPRDPEKASLMKELGMETTMQEVTRNLRSGKPHRRCVVPESKNVEHDLNLECELES